MEEHYMNEIANYASQLLERNSRIGYLEGQNNFFRFKLKLSVNEIESLKDEINNLLNTNQVQTENKTKENAKLSLLSAQIDELSTTLSNLKWGFKKREDSLKLQVEIHKEALYNLNFTHEKLKEQMKVLCNGLCTQLDDNEEYIHYREQQFLFLHNYQDEMQHTLQSIDSLDLPNIQQLITNLLNEKIKARKKDNVFEERVTQKMDISTSLIDNDEIVANITAMEQSRTTPIISSPTNSRHSCSSPILSYDIQYPENDESKHTIGVNEMILLEEQQDTKGNDNADANANSCENEDDFMHTLVITKESLDHLDHDHNDEKSDKNATLETAMDNNDSIVMLGVIESHEEKFLSDHNNDHNHNHMNDVKEDERDEEEEAVASFVMEETITTRQIPLPTTNATTTTSEKLIATILHHVGIQTSPISSPPIAATNSKHSASSKQPARTAARSMQTTEQIMSESIMNNFLLEQEVITEQYMHNIQNIQLTLGEQLVELDLAYLQQQVSAKQITFAATTTSETNTTVATTASTSSSSSSSSVATIAIQENQYQQVTALEDELNIARERILQLEQMNASNDQQLKTFQSFWWTEQQSLQQQLIDLQAQNKVLSLQLNANSGGGRRRSRRHNHSQSHQKQQQQQQHLHLQQTNLISPTKTRVPSYEYLDGSELEDNQTFDGEQEDEEESSSDSSSNSSRSDSSENTEDDSRKALISSTKDDMLHRMLFSKVTSASPSSSRKTIKPSQQYHQVSQSKPHQQIQQQQYRHHATLRSPSRIRIPVIGTTSSTDDDDDDANPKYIDGQKDNMIDQHKPVRHRPSTTATLASLTSPPPQTSTITTNSSAKNKHYYPTTPEEQMIITYTKGKELTNEIKVLSTEVYEDVMNSTKKKALNDNSNSNSVPTTPQRVSDKSITNPDNSLPMTATESHSDVSNDVDAVPVLTTNEGDENNNNNNDVLPLSITKPKLITHRLFPDIEPEADRVYSPVHHHHTNNNHNNAEDDDAHNHHNHHKHHHDHNNYNKKKKKKTKATTTTTNHNNNNMNIDDLVHDKVPSSSNMQQDNNTTTTTTNNDIQVQEQLQQFETMRLDWENIQLKKKQNELIAENQKLLREVELYRTKIFTVLNTAGMDGGGCCLQQFPDIQLSYHPNLMTNNSGNHAGGYYYGQNQPSTASSSQAIYIVTQLIQSHDDQTLRIQGLEQDKQDIYNLLQTTIDENNALKRDLMKKELIIEKLKNIMIQSQKTLTINEQDYHLLQSQVTTLSTKLGSLLQENVTLKQQLQQQQQQPQPQQQTSALALVPARNNIAGGGGGKGAKGGVAGGGGGYYISNNPNQAMMAVSTGSVGIGPNQYLSSATKLSYL